MNLKIKAGLQTVGFFVLVYVVAAVMSKVVETVTADQLKMAGIVALAALLAYTVYNILLSQLEYRERLKQVANKE